MSLVREDVFIETLVVKILEMFDTGSSSGPNISNFVLTTKGGLITTDGIEDPAELVEFLPGPDGYILIADNNEPFSLRWSQTGAPVDSVNGKPAVPPGSVSLTTADINQTTTKGQIYVQNNLGTVGILDPASDGFVLVADNSQPLGVRWATQPPPNVLSVNGNVGAVALTLADIDPTTTKGQLIAYSTGSTVLNVGPDGTRLEVDTNTSTGIKWGILDPEPVTTVRGTNSVAETGVVVLEYDDLKVTTAKGDLVVDNGFSNVAFTPVGIDTQILIANSLTGSGIQWVTNTLLTDARKSNYSFAYYRTGTAGGTPNFETIIAGVPPIGGYVLDSLNPLGDVLPATTFDNYDNTSGAFDANNGTYTVPVGGDGIYLLNLKCFIQGAGIGEQLVFLHILINGVSQQRVRPFVYNASTFNSNFYSFSTYVQLNQGDALRVGFENNGGNPQLQFNIGENRLLYSLSIC